MNTSKKVLMVAAVAAAAVLGVAGSKWYGDNRKPNFSASTDLYVRPGCTVEDVLGMIPDSIVLRKRSLRSVMRKNLSDSSLRVGHYVVEKGKPSIYVVRMLRGGWQTPVNLVLSGTMRRKEQIARKIGNQLMLDSADVYKALEDSVLLAGYGVTPRDVFSLFIPDTYQMYWTASVRDIFDRLKKARDDYWTEERVAKAKSQSLTPEEVSILASIVDGETHYVPEQPTIAGVYLNRLHLGMKLQADPTVAYCYGYSLNRILKRHLEIDSPYNTYMYAGLPPGQI